MTDRIKHQLIRKSVRRILAAGLLAVLAFGCGKSDSGKSVRGPVSRAKTTKQTTEVREMGKEKRSNFESQYERVPKPKQKKSKSPTEKTP